MKIKNICCIGAGYVGGPTMAVIALKCPEIKVTVVDLNEDRILAWNGPLENLPIYEPGLEKVVKETRGKNLFFSKEVDQAIDEAEMIFISVNTPTKTYGEGKGYASDLTYVEKCSRQIAKISTSDKIIVEKSTLPVRTAEKIREVVKSVNSSLNFEVLSNPEFLAEGSAINDLLNTDRVLIGGDLTSSGQIAVDSLSKIYQNWVPIEKIIKTNIWSSELSKLAANAILAQRVSSINSLSALCESTGADIEEVSFAVGMDSRIGNKFLKASIGFGGSCFKKDILNLVYLCNFFGLGEVADYWESVVKINDYQKIRFTNRIIEKSGGTVNRKKITLLGWSFKANTNDSRETAAIDVTIKLLEEGAEVSIYDPKVKKNQIILDIQNKLKSIDMPLDKIKDFLRRVEVHESIINSISSTFGIVIITEWDEFKKLRWESFFNIVNRPANIFDGRNILESEAIKKTGFNYYSIGR